MAVKLKDLQGLICTTLKATELFANESVIADLGYQQKAQETALSLRGVCLVVSPFVAAGSGKDAQGSPIASTAVAALLMSKTIVSIRTNPPRNAAPKDDSVSDLGGANINIYDAVTTVIHALLGWKNETNPTEKRFELDGDDAIILANDDPGCLTYDIRFRKTISA